MAWDGFVQQTGKYRSIRHMEYPKFQTGIFGRMESAPCIFLDQYTSGKAKELIKGHLQMKSGDPYEGARRLLKKHFGDPYKIAGAYIAKLSS